MREIATRAEREVPKDDIVAELMRLRDNTPVSTKRQATEVATEAPPPKGTMFTYPQSFRAYKGLIAAQYSGNFIHLCTLFASMDKCNLLRTICVLADFPLLLTNTDQIYIKQGQVGQ